MGEIVSNSGGSSNEGQKIPTPPSKGRKSFNKRKMTTIIAISAAVLVGIVIIILVFKYAVKHKQSTNMNAKFRVESISVSPLQLSSSQISALWDIRFAVQNPSTKSVLYQRVEIRIFYEQERLGSATIAPFRILDNNWTPINGQLIATSVEVNEQAIKDMTAEMANGSVKFNIGLGAGYWVGDNEQNRVWWAVDACCNDVTVGFLSKDMAGILVGGPIGCRVTKTW